MKSKPDNFGVARLLLVKIRRTVVLHLKIIYSSKNADGIILLSFFGSSGFSGWLRQT